MEHGLPRKGFAFDGLQIAERAYLVARIRWTWHLQRHRFRDGAVSGVATELGDQQSGLRMSTILSANSAWDIDLVVAYGAPHWADGFGKRRGDVRVGPLSNDAGLWLTATSHHRSQMKVPSPPALVPPLPGRGEKPIRIMCAGAGLGGSNDFYWFVETVTSRELLEREARERAST